MLKYFIAFLLVTGVIPVKLYNAEISEKSSYSVIQPEDKPKESPVFRNVKVKERGNEFIIKGEARTRNGSLFYTVEDGHNELVSAKMIKLNSIYPDWSPFKITLRISKEKLPENGTLIIYLNEQNESGQMINTFPMILYQQPRS